MSQNRQTQRDRIKAEHDYQINKKDRKRNTKKIQSTSNKKKKKIN